MSDTGRSRHASRDLDPGSHPEPVSEVPLAHVTADTSLSDSLSLFSPEETGDATHYQTFSIAGPLAGDVPAAVPRTPRPSPRSTAAATRPATDESPRSTETRMAQLQLNLEGLERSLHDLRTTGSLLSGGFSRLEQIQQDTERRQAQVAATLAELEQRVGPLDAIRTLTSGTDDRLAMLRRLAEDVAGREAALGTQRASIEAQDAALARVHAQLADVDARIARVSHPDAHLTRVEAALHAAERRAGDAAADIEEQAAERAALAASLEQARHEVASLMANLAQLHARLAALHGPHQPLVQAEATIARLESRATRASEAFESRAEALVAAIEQQFGSLETRHLSLRDAADAAARHTAVAMDALDARMATLDTRIAGLGAPTHLIAQAEANVQTLERRTATAAAQIQAVVQAAADLERSRARARRLAIRQAAADTIDGLHRTASRGASAAVSGGSRLARTASRLAHGFAHAVRSDAAALLTGISASRRSVRRFAAPAAASRRTGPHPERAAARRLVGDRPWQWATAAGGVAILAFLGAAVMNAPDQQASTSGPAMAGSPAVVGSGIGDRVLPADGASRRRAPAATARRSARAARAVNPARSRQAAGPTLVGELAVHSMPAGAAVYLDDKHVGQTPISLRKLRPGSHAVQLEMRGFERWTTAVRVNANRKTNVATRLRPASARQE